MEINELPNEDKQKLFILNLLQQKSQPLLLAFGRDSKSERGVTKLYNGKKREVQVCSVRGSWHEKPWLLG